VTGMDCCCAAGTQVSGQVRGCSGLPIPSVTTLTFRDSSGTNLLGTIATDAAGNYSGSISGVTSPNTTVRAYWSLSDVFAGRFNAGGFANLIVNPGANTGKNVNVILASPSAYACSPLAYFPLNKTLHLTDSYTNVTRTITWVTGTNAWQSAFTNTAYPGCPAQFCAATTSPVQYTFNAINTGVINITYGNDPNCPIGLFVQGGGVDTPVMTVNSISPFNATVTLPATNTSKWYCSHSSLFTLTE
jgi:hypothetical protein